MKSSKLRALALLVTASTLLGMGTAYAATQLVTSDIKYVTALSFAVVNHPVFGYVKQGQVGNYILSTAGAVTTSGGGVTEGGSTNAGDYTIIGSTGQTMNITVGSPVADGGSTPSAPVCSLNGAADVAGCTYVAAAAPGAGADLKVGLTIASAGTTPDGTTEHPTLTITVLYN